MEALKITEGMQPYRIIDLCKEAELEESPEDFMQKRQGRSLSSIEEELLCALPQFDEEEQKAIYSRAVSLLEGTSLSFPSSRAFQEVARRDAKLGKELRAAGLMNFQHLMQSNFYHQVIGLLEQNKKNEKPLEYQSVTPVPFLGVNSLCLESYSYGGAASYRAAFYQLMRHLTNIHGGETQRETIAKAHKAFAGKRVLELGCGPGYFLTLLEQLGAQVVGVEKNEKLAPSANKGVVFGDAKNLESLVQGPFDVIFSRDFLSVHVTKEDAGEIMQSALKLLKPKGISLHIVDYSKMSEERYKHDVLQKLSQESSANPTHYLEGFESLTPEQRDIVLRKNILNIHPGRLVKMGYIPLAPLRIDLETNLSLVMSRSLTKTAP